MTKEPSKHYVFFSGAALQRIAAEATEVRDTPGAQMQVRGSGEHMVISFVADGYQGPDINNSHPCPGSPGCT